MRATHPSVRLWSSHRAALTAREELERALERAAAARGVGAAPGADDGPVRWAGAIHLGLFGDLPDRDELIRQGLTSLHDVDPARDAFEGFGHSGELYLLGSSPRGLLHAVYALEEALVFARDVEPEWRARGVFHLGQRHFHPRFDRWPGERADVRYLSRLGASHCLVSHDWQGSLRNLQGYVTSPVFPDAVPRGEVDRNRAGLRRLLEDCADYGLAASLWITELPCQGGPWVPEPERQAWLGRFPAEVLSVSGTYQGKVLCFSHPQVQAFYRDLVHRFLAEFPEVETLFLFGMDSGGEGCDPSSCPRCRGMSKFEQRDRLIRFLADEGGRARPSFRVLTTGWHWESSPDEFLERQRGLPASSGVYLAAESDGWQAERQSHDFLRRVRAVCRERGQLFLGYDDLHLGDDATHLWGVDLQDYPLGVAAKLARWHELGADGVFDHWGTYSEMVSSNSVACREHLLAPLADAEAVCRRIARNQYGASAGEPAFRAWQAIERAHGVLSSCATWAPGQWPAWYAGKERAPLPDSLNVQLCSLESQRLVPKPASGFTYNGGTLADCLEAVGTGWRDASIDLEEACRFLQEGIGASSDEPIGYAFFWNGAAPSPSRREHLERHKLYVELMLHLGREIGLHFELLALFERGGRDPERYLAVSAPLVREDLEACRALVAVMADAVRRFPEAAAKPPARWREQYERKAREIESSGLLGAEGGGEPRTSLQ